MRPINGDGAGVCGAGSITTHENEQADFAIDGATRKARATMRVPMTALDLDDVDVERRAAVAMDHITVARRQWQREHRRPPALTARETLAAVKFEVLFLVVAYGNSRNGVELTDEDLDRVDLALARLEAIFSEVA